MKRLEHLAMIAHDMGLIFHYLALITVIPFAVLVLYREWDLVLPMASVPASFFVLGSLMARVPKRERVPQMSVAIAGVALTWFAVALIGSLPFILGLHMSITDSIFESMSGWSTTGFTMMTSLDIAPKTLIFWRSLIQWLGGIGVIAFGIAMMSGSGIAQFKLYRSEGRQEALMPNVVETGRRMLATYLSLTTIGVLLLLFSGIPVWDAVNLVMTAISTGGFSVHEGGMAYYGNPLLELLLVPVMLAGSIPIQLFFFAAHGKFSKILGDSSLRAVLLFAAAGSFFIVLDLHLFNDLPFLDAVRQGIFCAVSGLTTTGFQNANPHLWASLPVIMLTMLIMVGGARGSTSGGIKVNRIVLGYRGLIWWFRRYFARSNVIVPFQYEGKNIPKDISELELSKNMLIIILYVLTIFVAAILALHLFATSFPVYEVIFELVSALSNCGLGLGYLTPASPIAIKWLFIFLMWFGRLEFVPVIILAMGLARGFDTPTAT